MKKVAADTVDVTALPYRFVAAFYFSEILVRSVNKADRKFTAAKILNDAFFIFSAVPKVSEIAADYKDIAAFQLAPLRIVQSRLVAVHITGNIYHAASPFFLKFYK